jgi:predicted small integral membrane protein
LPSAEALTSYEADRSSDDGKPKKCCSTGVPTDTSRLVSPHALRLAKILLTTSLAAFAFIVAYDNGVYYGSNYEFVRHVLSMDTTFPTNTLRTRAITNPALWNAAYVAIITTEALTALAFAKGAYDLLRNLRAPAQRFQAAKRFAIIGATIAFLLWFTGFMVIGGEYFSMWQSAIWNGQQAAFRFYVTVLLVLIVVLQPDQAFNHPPRAVDAD